jgi:phosphate starvation-inducible protein PhoH
MVAGRPIVIKGMEQNTQPALEQNVVVEEEAHVQELTGDNNINFDLIAQFFDVHLSATGHQVCVKGHSEYVHRTVRFLHLLLSEIGRGKTIAPMT